MAKVFLGNIRGPQGIQGLKGDTGAKGDTGLTGPQGIPGKDGNPAGFGEISAEITNTTGTPTVQVISSGPDTKKQIHFSFSNIKGDRGEQGPQGIQGIPGPIGERGLPAGIATPVTRYTEDGGAPSVEVTTSGPNIAKVFNFTFKNLKGVQGPQGERGRTGLTGPAGTPGAAAGFGTPTASISNTTGVPSVSITTSGDNTAKVFHFDFANLKGDRGPIGPTGIQGPEGPRGLQGPQGPQGIAGSAGAQGPKGDPGVGIATGGNIGDVLYKKGVNDFDTGWKTLDNYSKQEIDNKLTSKADKTALGDQVIFRLIGTTLEINTK